MELNYTDLASFTTNLYEMREHDNYASYEPAITFSYDSGQSSAETYSTDPALGDGYNFFSIKSSFANGKYIRFRWKFDSDYILYKNLYFRVYDGTYNRMNDTHFPDDNPIITFGNGLLYSYRITSGDNSFQTKDVLIDLDSWESEEENITVFWLNHDYNNQYRSYMYVDWIEINSESGGSGNLYTIDFNASTNRVNEVTGTDGDYAYMNNTGLPLQSGGYLAPGYFSTVDYGLSVNGSGLTLLTNSTIPSGTSISVQFSLDNSTWVNQHNASGSTELSGGFESFDLRDINSTVLYVRFNFVGSDTDTPRLYQSRLVSTENGGGVTGNGVTVIESDAPWVALAIILSLISALLFMRKR